MARGDHIKVCRQSYDHHGIDIGGGWIIHYTGDAWAKISGQDVELIVRRERRRVFADGAQIKVVAYEKPFSVEETIQNARSRLGEQSYDVRWNNCEHFATWCKTGAPRSGQVEGVFGALGTATGGLVASVVAGPALAVGTVFGSAGNAAGREIAKNGATSPQRRSKSPKAGSQKKHRSAESSPAGAAVAVAGAAGAGAAALAGAALAGVVAGPAVAVTAVLGMAVKSLLADDDGKKR